MPVLKSQWKNSSDPMNLISIGTLDFALFNDESPRSTSYSILKIFLLDFSAFISDSDISF